MSNIHSKYKDKEGNTLTISYDLDPESPREWDGNIGQFLFPDDSKYLHWEKDCLRYDLDELREEHDKEYDYGCFVSNRDLIDEYLKDNFVKAYPLYKYEHSGIVLSLSPFSCRWDSGQIGWYVITKESIDKYEEDHFYCYDKEESDSIKELCESELRIFNQYLSGEIYGYTYTSTDGEEDSCWGYYAINEILEQFEGMEIVNE